MRLFTVIATREQRGRVSFEMEVRITVEARTLQDAFKSIRKEPAFRGAYLRPA